jgi:hypothetical protein
MHGLYYQKGKLTEKLQRGADLARYCHGIALNPGFSEHFTTAGVMIPAFFRLWGNSRALPSLAVSLQGNAVICNPLNPYYGANR